ncbi:MAG: tyrosine-type recombinase/integrase [Verrucomicrobiae bacterium]|nr:tyrosine-type recombinase/integrase [Verrucomicrobiae bacterium]
MKNVYHRKGGYWYSKMTEGKRIWVNLQTADYAEAIKRALEIQENPLVKSPHTAMDDAHEFVGHKLRMNQYSRASATAKLYTLRQFFQWLPERTSAAAVTSKQVAEYYAHLQRTLSESTAQGYMMTLRSFFQWATEVKRLRVDNPVKSVKLAKWTSKGRQQWCQRSLKNKLIEAAPNDDLRFILFCGFDAGLRRGEISECRRDWFDLKAGLLHVRKAEGPPRLGEGQRPFLPKDRDERTVPLTAPFRKFLRRYLKGRSEYDFALMPGVSYGKAKYRYDFRKPFDDYLKTKACQWVTPHVMRHSFASILASAGVSIFKVAQWLGDDVRVVQRHYAKLAAGDSDIHALTSAVSAG